jgi:hypothetical protein
MGRLGAGDDIPGSPLNYSPAFDDDTGFGELVATKMCPRLWSSRWVEMIRLIRRKIITMSNGHIFTRETLLYAAGTRIPGRFFGG